MDVSAPASPGSARPCEICGRPTRSLVGLCADHYRLGPKCPVCGVERIGQSRAPMCVRCVHERAPKCKQCGDVVQGEFDLCFTCAPKCPECGWVLRDGRCTNKHTTTKPHQTATWRRRRAELIARTDKCEWCGAAFTPPKKPAVVHHTVERPMLPDGSPDWDRYYAMRDDEVAIVCKGCHHLWSQHRAKPDDPRIKCAGCGGFKKPRFDLCFACNEKLEALMYADLRAGMGGPPLSGDEARDLARLLASTERAGDP